MTFIWQNYYMYFSRQLVFQLVCVYIMSISCQYWHARHKRNSMLIYVYTLISRLYAYREKMCSHVRFFYKTKPQLLEHSSLLVFTVTQYCCFSRLRTSFSTRCIRSLIGGPPRRMMTSRICVNHCTYDSPGIPSEKQINYSPSK